MIFENLLDEIFWKPLKRGADKLIIISGYATPNMTSWLFKNIEEHTENLIEVSLIVGMVPYDGLSVAVHEGFKKLMFNTSAKNIKKFTCSYIYDNAPVQSKLYLWMKNGKPYSAYTGSAEFIQESFTNRRRELMIKCDEIQAYEYYKCIDNDSIYCNHAEVEEHIILHATHPILDENNMLKKNIDNEDIPLVTLSLLTKTGETGRKSGINWGHREGRNKNEAYISVPAKIAKSGFFPFNKEHFTVVTDDGHQLILEVQQQNDKAITTPLSNAQLGEYLRNRLGMPNGAFIQKADLVRYGRTDITFYKLDDEQYYMDFSVIL